MLLSVLVKVLESGDKISQETKLCMLRTLTDMTMSVTAVKFLVKDSALLVGIVNLINDDDFELARQAVRFVKSVVTALLFCKVCIFDFDRCAFSLNDMKLTNFMDKKFAMKFTKFSSFMLNNTNPEL